MSSLASATFLGVEVLEAGVPIHGRGSAPSGDVHTVGKPRTHGDFDFPPGRA